MSDSEDSDDVFAVAPQMHAFSDSDDGNDGAEAKFLGVCKPSPVSVSVATPAPQAAAARDAVLDEWGDDSEPAAKKAKVAEVDPKTAEAFWRNQQILRRLQAPEELEEEVEEVEEAVCVDDGDVEIVEAPDLGHGAPLTLVLRTKSNKSYEVETTTTAPLSEVFERFHASDLGKALVEELGRQAKFSFDGEALQPTQTALQVELEDRDIVDAL